MSAEAITELLFSFLRIICMISLGIFFATLIEQVHIEKKLFFLLKILCKHTGLSTVGATAFITSFASPRAANTLLASACDEGTITKKEMILSALINSLGAWFAHMKIMAFIIVSLLGYIGLAYLGVQIVAIFLTMGTSFILLKKGGDQLSDTITEIKEKNKQHGFIKILLARNKKILLRVLSWTLPLYTIIYILNYNGFFEKLSTYLPQFVKTLLPPEAMAVIGIQFSGILQSASAASLLMKDDKLSSTQVFITLLLGYILSTPIRAIRHTLPSALGIFPGKTGLIIVAIIQGTRIIVALVILVIIIMFTSL